MDLSSPLRALIPSLDSAVLEVLARTESAVGASALVRLAPRGSRSGLLEAVNRLVAQGIVLAQPANTGALYRLNRDHLLAPAVLSVAHSGRDVVSLLRAGVTALRPRPLRASLFGSFARGEAGADSDIDLLLVVDDDVDTHDDGWTGQVRALADEVARRTGNRLEPLVLTAADVRDAERAGEAIVGEWDRDGIRLDLEQDEG